MPVHLPMAGIGRDMSASTWCGGLDPIPPPWGGLGSDSPPLLNQGVYSAAYVTADHIHPTRDSRILGRTGLYVRANSIHGWTGIIDV